MRAKKHTVAALAGLLHTRGRKPVTLAQMNDAVAAAAVTRVMRTGHPGQRRKRR